MKPNSIWKYAVLAVLTCIVLPIPSAHSTAPQTAAQAQPTAASPDDPKFAAFVCDIVSIKPYKDDPTATVHRMGMQELSDGFALRGAPFTVFIGQAYRTEHFKISGAPDWLNQERYDVDAKMDSEVADAFQKLGPDDQKLARQHMLRVILRDYLKLTFHMEKTEVPIYELVIAKNGPRLKPPADPNTPGRGVRVAGVNGAMTYDAKNAPITAILNQLSFTVGRPIFDKTGLTGTYDIALRFTPERPGSAMPSADIAAAPEEAPPIMIALEEQLGLKLVPAKGPMDAIVIDHAERPAVN